MVTEHEEYGGYFLARGITMPAQGIHDINVYGSLSALEREDEPIYRAESMEEAKKWIDQPSGLSVRTVEGERERRLISVFPPIWR